ncbi:hypothetical protein DDZ13_00090 [Coraliomargarita sinensis]|uniref:Uncharacterized protein n=1 Tax=Coraliomargarita sinensis TaxID=2174842 RepID=A0A317ZN78_9BACT|nr:hypothetical protein [Coraliomargarita sinensis]PXA05299.1 hypothetical protein DDZ13_00090 [Coraliomargarita sinensis]
MSCLLAEDDPVFATAKVEASDQTGIVGNWEGELMGAPKHDRVRLTIWRERRSPEGPLQWSVEGKFYPDGGPRSDELRGSRMNLDASQLDKLVLRVQYAYKDDVDLLKMTPSALGMEMAGTWKTRGGDTGKAVLRRVLPKIERIQIGKEERKALSQSVTITKARFGTFEFWKEIPKAEFDYDEHWWEEETNAQRGNRPSIELAVYGENFWGGIRTRVLGEPDFETIVEPDFWDTYASAIRQQPGGAVIGYRTRITLWDNVKPGTYQVDVNGARFPLELVINGFPEPKLHSLEVLTDQTNPYFMIGGNTPDYVAGAQANLYGNALNRTLLVRLKDYKYSRDKFPVFKDPEGAIVYYPVSVKRGDKADMERRSAFEQYDLSIAQAEDKELILVEARVPPNTESSFKRIIFRDQMLPWAMLYSDLGGQLQLARQIPNSNPRIADKWIPASFAMVGDRVRLEMIFTKAPGFDSVPVRYSAVSTGMDSPDLPIVSPEHLFLKPTEDPTIYASAPFHVRSPLRPMHQSHQGDPNERAITLPLPTAANDEKEPASPGRLVFSVDTDWRREHFLGPVSPLPREASAIFGVHDVPPEKTLWLEALEQAVACVPDFEFDPRMEDSLPAVPFAKIGRYSLNSAVFSDVFTGEPPSPLRGLNPILYLWDPLKGEARNQPRAYVSVGHVAALLLMKGELHRLLEEKAGWLNSLLNRPDRLLRMLEQMPPDQESPYRFVEYASPKGKAMYFWELKNSDEYLMKKTGYSNVKELNDWKAKQLNDATHRLLGMIEDAQEEIKGVKNCNARALLELVSDTHRPILNSLRPKLVKKVNNKNFQSWVADESALNWIKMVSDLAAELEERDHEADIDDLALTFETLPLGFLIGNPYASLIYDAVFAVSDIGRASYSYVKSGHALTVARGKAFILGQAYYERADVIAKQACRDFAKQLAMTGLSFAASQGNNLINGAWRKAAGVDPDAPVRDIPGSRAAGDEGLTVDLSPEPAGPSGRLGDTELVPPPSGRLGDTEALPTPVFENASGARSAEVGGGTSIDMEASKLKERYADLEADWKDGLPEGATRDLADEAEDLFRQPAGSRLRDISDIDAYLRRLEAKSAAGETLTPDEMLDKLEIMRLREVEAGRMSPEDTGARAAPGAGKVPEEPASPRNWEKTVEINPNGRPDEADTLVGP